MPSTLQRVPRNKNSLEFESCLLPLQIVLKSENMPYICLLVPRLHWEGSKLRKRNWESATQYPCPVSQSSSLRRMVVEALVSCWKAAALHTPRVQQQQQLARHQVKCWERSAHCLGQELALFTPACCFTSFPCLQSQWSPLSNNSVVLLVWLVKGRNPASIFHILFCYFYLKIKINLNKTSALLNFHVCISASSDLQGAFPLSPQILFLPCFCHGPANYLLSVSLSSSKLKLGV